MTVFSKERMMEQPECHINGLEMDAYVSMDGLEMMSSIPNCAITTAFLDPQYRGILDEMSYGQSRQPDRQALPQMEYATITRFCEEIARVLTPHGHLFLWTDKYHLTNPTENVHAWMADTSMEIVDMVVWNKQRMGMGYRTRRCSEYLFIYQKPPKRVKGVWMSRSIPDVWDEKPPSSDHPHAKPLALTGALIEAVTPENGIVLDPAAGSFTTMHASHEYGRKFIGCDLMPPTQRTLK